MAGSSQTSHWPPMGKPPRPLLSGMPAFWRRCRLPPPAPTKTKRAELRRSCPVARSRMVADQPVAVLARSTTRWLLAMPQRSWRPSQPRSLRETSPKFTSVPELIRVAAMGTSPRLSVSSGAHAPMVARSVENAMSAKKWWAAMPVWRARR